MMMIQQHMEACLHVAHALSGIIYDSLLQAQPCCNVEGIGPAWDAPQQLVGPSQRHLIKLHAGVLEALILVLEGCQGAAYTHSATSSNSMLAFSKRVSDLLTSTLD